MKAFIKIIPLALLFFIGCKSDFLDAKPSTDLLTPKSLEDYRKLLNYNGLYVSPAMGFLSADEYVYNDVASWKARTGVERNTYVWNSEIYEGELAIQDWNRPYQTIFYANNVIDGLKTLPIENKMSYSQVKGWAHFLRAFAYFDLSGIFAKAYYPETANSDLGLPLKLSGRIDEVVGRSSVKSTYDQIVHDLRIATSLLPAEFQQSNRMSPSKATSHAMLARVFLSMNMYEQAELHADSSLTYYSKLTDYNTISTTAVTPFPILNDEVLFGTIMVGYTANINGVSNTFVTIDPTLIASYSPNDLRLPIFFSRTSSGSYYLKRGYHGAGSFSFSGLATDEVYLIKAECLARKNEVNASMNILNQLLIKRFRNSTPYVPIVASNRDEAIAIVLLERRKELVWRGQRWTDIKRLNAAGANILLKRSIDGKEYNLSPNSNRYALPIPDDEMMRSNLIQNPR